MILLIFFPDLSIRLYADDTKLYFNICCSDDRVLLQSDINSVIEWSSTWQLSLAVNKCSVLHVGTHATNHYYRLGVSSLPICNTISDLGVEVDNLLSFETHIHNMVSIANRRIYLIRRYFHSEDIIYLIKSFVVFVRPLLEYCSPVSCPSYKHLVDSVESVQRRFTKYLPCFSSVSYSERLKCLELDTLELYRLYIDLTLYFKTCNGCVALN